MAVRAVLGVHDTLVVPLFLNWNLPGRRSRSNLP